MTMCGVNIHCVCITTNMCITDMESKCERIGMCLDVYELCVCLIIYIVCTCGVVEESRLYMYVCLC